MKAFSIALLLAICGSSVMAQDVVARYQNASQIVHKAVWDMGYGPALICAINYVVREKGTAVAEAYVSDLEALAAKAASYSSLTDLMLESSRLPRNHGIRFEDQTAMTAECGIGI